MLNDSSSKQGLAIHEWVAVSSLMVVLLTIAVSSFFNKYTSASYDEKISVFVTGAIVESKKVLLPEGSRIIDVLSSVELLNNADTEKMALDSFLKPNGTVVVPCKGGISLYISGAVAKEGVIVVPEGVRFHDLVNYIVLAPQADEKWILRKKRLVKDGECIAIPERKDKKNNRMAG